MRENECLSFAEFCKDQESSGRVVSESEARKRFLQLSVGAHGWDENGRLPEENDAFYPEQICEVSDGDWPGWTQQEMLAWFPEVIRSKFGRAGASVLNGPFLLLDAKDEERIVAAFRASGYECTKDEPLVQTASGY
jgi:hypothetical protein